MKVVVTGGAGFIGSNLADRLETEAHEVVVLDNFSTGQERFLSERPFRGRVVRLDLLTDTDTLRREVSGAAVVVHLAANADVRYGWDAPRRDLDQNLIVTLNVCEAMRSEQVRRLIFSSTGSVYGEATEIPTPELCDFPAQTSLYGASKAAAEGYLAAYAEADFLDVTVFRFVSILGARYTHGHVIDFVRSLRQNPSLLEVLGDGRQRKSYLDVDDCVDAISRRLVVRDKFEVFNLGVDGYCTVAESARWICDRMGVQPEIRFLGGNRGWIGDNPFIWLDTRKIRASGWEPKVSIRAAVERTVDYLLANPWVIEART